MRLGAIALTAALALVGCGGGSDHHRPDASTAASATPTRPPQTQTTSKLPPGAVGPTDTAEQQAEGPAATEASPESPANGPQASGEPSAAERSAVSAVIGTYIQALDQRNARRTCAVMAPGALRIGGLARPHQRCISRLAGAIGKRPPLGGPAWRRTVLPAVKVERLNDERARASATVVHHFSDRKYVSVEDDVIYLERIDGRWLLAKPSGTLYRAVGYESPPLEAFRPPPGWAGPAA